MISLTNDTKSLLDGILVYFKFLPSRYNYILIKSLQAAAVDEDKIPAVSFAVTTADEEIYIGHAGRKAIHKPP